MFTFNGKFYAGITKHSIYIQECLEEYEDVKYDEVDKFILTDSEFIFIDNLCLEKEEGLPPLIPSTCSEVLKGGLHPLDIEYLIKFCKYYGIEKVEKILNEYYSRRYFSKLSIEDIKDKFYIDSKVECYDDCEIEELKKKWSFII